MNNCTQNIKLPIDGTWYHYEQGLDGRINFEVKAKKSKPNGDVMSPPSLPIEIPQQNDGQYQSPKSLQGRGHTLQNNNCNAVSDAISGKLVKNALAATSSPLESSSLNSSRSTSTGIAISVSDEARRKLEARRKVKLPEDVLNLVTKEFVDYFKNNMHKHVSYKADELNNLLFKCFYQPMAMWGAIFDRIDENRLYKQMVDHLSLTDNVVATLAAWELNKNIKEPSGNLAEVHSQSQYVEFTTEHRADVIDDFLATFDNCREGFNLRVLKENLDFHFFDKQAKLGNVFSPTDKNLLWEDMLKRLLEIRNPKGLLNDFDYGLELALRNSLFMSPY